MSYNKKKKKTCIINNTLVNILAHTDQEKMVLYDYK